MSDNFRTVSYEEAFFIVATEEVKNDVQHENANRNVLEKQNEGTLQTMLVWRVFVQILIETDEERNEDYLH